MSEETLKYYEKAIVVFLGDHNWKRICGEIAKRDPKLFCEAVEEIEK